ncbi:MAG: restriction endonuclease subunit S [Nitritalea sp.]
MAQGIPVVHLYNSQLKNLEIEIPCKEEQEKVVTFLRTLDQNLETLNNQIQSLRT